MIVHWLTDDATIGVIRYGVDREDLARIEIDKDTTTDHILKLTNLKPATRYYYQVGDISGFSEYDAEKNWFKTYPEDIVATRVWVIGDSGEAGETLNQVRDSAFSWMRSNPISSSGTIDNLDDKSLNNKILDKKSEAKVEKQAVKRQTTALQTTETLPTKIRNGAGGSEPVVDIWLALGDIAYRSGTNAQYQAALFEPFEHLLSNVALLPVYGNHDDRRWTYFRIFDLPENGEAGGLASETENYYAVDYSNIHFVILDSQASGLSSTGKMAVWLKNDLAKNTKPWIVAAIHHPPYSKGTHNSDDDSDSGGRMEDVRNNILPILEAAGVDLVLSGHSHMYERSYMIDCAYDDSKNFSSDNIVSSGVNNKHQKYLKPLDKKQHQGTVYVVAGSSSKVDQGPLDHPAHFVGLQEAGSVVIDVVDNKLISRFINEKGQVKDVFSIEKSAEYLSPYKGCQ